MKFWLLYTISQTEVAANNYKLSLTVMDTGSLKLEWQRVGFL